MRAIYFETSIPRVLATLALKRLWGGVVFSSIAPVRMDNIAEPELPGPRWIRVRNSLCGVCASDLHLLFVDVDPKSHAAAIAAYDRYYLGHEVVSEVIEVGSGVQTLTPGDRVLMHTRFIGPTCRSQEIEPLCPSCAKGDYSICSNVMAGVGPRGVGGGWSDGYTCHESEVWKVPAELTDEQAILLEPLACGVRAVLKRLPEPEESALVLGCGTVGLATIQAVRALRPEAKVFALARYPHQAELAEAFGAELLPGGDLLETAAEATDGKVIVGELGNRTVLGGFDVVYDCVGTAKTLGDSLRITRAGGAVVLEGISIKRFPKLDLTPVWHQEVDLVGACAHGNETWKGERISTFNLTSRLMQQGALTASGLITHRYSLDDWRAAVRTATDKQSKCIKVVFDFGET